MANPSVCVMYHFHPTGLQESSCTYEVAPGWSPDDLRVWLAKHSHFPWKLPCHNPGKGCMDGVYSNKHSFFFSARYFCVSI